jgi:hypothetical protein
MIFRVVDYILNDEFLAVADRRPAAGVNDTIRAKETEEEFWQESPALEVRLDKCFTGSVKENMIVSEGLIGETTLARGTDRACPPTALVGPVTEVSDGLRVP